MRYTDDALYPENMAPLIITAASLGLGPGEGRLQ